MSTWEEDLTFPRGPFPPQRTHDGGVAFTAAQNDFAYATVVTLPPPPMPTPPPAPAPEPEVSAQPLPAPPVAEDAPAKRGLFGRKKSAPAPKAPQKKPSKKSARTPKNAPVEVPAAAAAAVSAPTQTQAPAATPGPTTPGAVRQAAAERAPELTRVPTGPAGDPAVAVVEDDAIEFDFLLEGEPEPPAKKRRNGKNGEDSAPEKAPKRGLFGRKKIADQPEGQDPDHAPAVEPAASAASGTAAGPEVAAAASAPQVINLVNETQTEEPEQDEQEEPEESPVTAWLGRARASVIAGAAAAAEAKAAGEDATDKAAQEADDASAKNGTALRGSHTVRADTETEAVPPADEQDEEDSEAQDEASKPRLSRLIRGKKGRGTKKGAEEPEAGKSKPKGFIPSFGFVLPPEYDLKWAAAAHWSTIPLLWFGLGFLGPFFVLAARGEQSQYVRAHATASLNFQISLLLYMLMTAFLGLLSGLLFLVPLLLGALAATAAWMATKSARAGTDAKYLFALPIF